MAKRKRDSDEKYETPLNKKKKIRATKSEGSAAFRRQQRSERKLNERRQKKGAVQPTSDAPELVEPVATANGDTLAAGEDFISLSMPAAVPNGSNEVAKAAKKKRKTPEQKKAERLKRKAAKIESKPTEAADGEPDQKSKETTHRFICFVGNLPFNCTTAQIQHHFRKLEPHVRHSTDKQTKKSKGFAFLEFDDYSKMKTCLKVYHHSIFDPERTSRLPESAFDENGLAKESLTENGKPTGRRINVELTAGGGGKGADRKEKIVQKNTKLFEERERRKKEEVKQSRHKDMKKKSEVNTTEIGAEAVHPSRMNRVR